MQGKRKKQTHTVSHPTAVTSRRRNGERTAPTKVTEPEISVHAFWAMRALFWSAFFCIGLFGTALTGLWGACGAVLLFVIYHKNKTLVLRGSVCAWCLLAVVFFAACTMIWGVDRGQAALGVVKLFACLVGAVLFMQLSSAQRRVLRDDIPRAMRAVLVLGVPFCFVPALRSYFLADGSRYGSFLQYPNTMALLCLIGAVILLEKMVQRRGRRWEYVTIVLLAAGILVSGSRIVFVLTAFTFVVYLLRYRTLRKVLLIGAAVCAVVVGTYLAVTKDVSVVGRFLTIFTSNNSLLCRLLYARDAMPMLLDYPLGMGTGGYASLAGSYATGVYQVRYVHNDILQIALDWGLPALALFLTAGVLSFKRGVCGFEGRMVWMLVIGHSLLDFDLQYAAVVLVLLLYADLYEAKPLVLHRAEKRFVMALCAVCGAVMLYVGGAVGLGNFGLSRVSLTLLPFQTDLRCRVITTSSDLQTVQTQAQYVLNQDEYNPQALSAMATVLYATGDGVQSGEYFLRAIAVQPYERTLYEQMVRTLSASIAQAQAEQDTTRMLQMMQQIDQMVRLRSQTLGQTSALGHRLEHKPNLALSAEEERYIAQVCTMLQSAS